jgi:hypothetical protein
MAVGGAPPKGLRRACIGLHVQRLASEVYDATEPFPPRLIHLGTSTYAVLFIGAVWRSLDTYVALKSSEEESGRRSTEGQ